MQNISRTSKKPFCSLPPECSNDGCFGPGARTHIRRGGQERSQRGSDQKNRRPEYKPPALNQDSMAVSHAVGAQ